MSKYELRSKKRQTKSDVDVKEVLPKRSKADTLTESSTKILDLNDDCFDKIFGYLRYDDVLLAAQVCQRFEDRAQDVFKRKKHNLLVLSVKANESKQLLRHIGPALLKLEIFFGKDASKNQQTIDRATRYCVDNLTEITLHCLTKRNKFRKPFGQVNKLTLSFCDLIGHFKLTKWFPNLSSLTFHNTKNLKKFIKQEIPTMHTLNINNCCATRMETITMLSSNPQIKNLSLEFTSQGGLVLRHSLLAAIDKALPELQTLNVIVDRVNNLEHEDLPLYFKHLKALKIENYSDYPNTSLVNHLAILHANLERLQLAFSDSAGDAHSYSCITKYKNLRTLQLIPARHSLSLDVILMLTHQLPLLDRIEQTVDFAKIVPWTTDEVTKFLRSSSDQLMELAFVFVHEAQTKFNRTLGSIQGLFNGTNWLVKTEERFAPKVFDTHGEDGMQKQLVISIVKSRSM